MISKFSHIAGALLLASPVVFAQISFSDCTKQCIDQSTDDSCSLSDLKCICRQSNGRFLPDLVACWKAECNSDLNINDLLDPMQLGCRLIGTPISQSALDNVRNMDDPVPQVTTTVIVTPSFTTVTSKGPSQTIVQVYPITEPSDSDDEEGQGTVTRYPPGTTLTRTQSSSSAATSLVPVVVVSVDEDGNTQTATSTQTITQSDSAKETGSMTTAGEEDAETTSTITAGASTATEETTVTTTDGSDSADATTSTQSGEQSADATTTATSGVSTSRTEATQTVDRLGGPFSQQPEGAATRGNPAAGLGLTIAIFVARLFY